VLQHNLILKLLSYFQRTPTTKGMTLAEALVVIVIVGVLSAIAAPNIFGIGSKPLLDTTNQIAGQFRSARTRATSQTSRFRIRPTNALGTATIYDCSQSNKGCLNNKIIVERAIAMTDCDAEPSTTGWVKDNDLYIRPEDLTFGKGVSISAVQINPPTPGKILPTTNWQLCFDSRGMADKDLILTFQQASDGKEKTFEIFPGGIVRINE
jgi:prepilin-type N-terminal cleavage/methylation domain-containing protein